MASGGDPGGPDLTPRPPVDLAIAALGARQFGVAEVGQLVAAGLSRRAQRKRVAHGRLVETAFPRVLGIGHGALSLDGHRMAATLSVGPEAALAAIDAAALHRLVPRSTGARWFVAAPRGGRRGSARVRVLPTRRLDDADVTEVRAIRVTSVARTIVDLADLVPRDRLAKIVHEAEVARVLDLHALEATMRRLRGRHGEPLLRAVLAD